MKNKIILAVIMAVVFVASSAIFSGSYVSSDTMGYILGLGALVVGYFGSKVAKTILLTGKNTA